MRRPLLTLAACALAVSAPAGATEPPPSGAKAPAPTPASTPKPERSWAHKEIRVVTSRGLMGGSEAAFRPDAPLTRGALEALVAALAGRSPVALENPSAKVTIAMLDARLVAALQLGSAARTFAASARTAGATVPSRFGTEVVARLLGLRTNHPAAQDTLELGPTDTATRAEAAFSAARILGLRSGEIQTAAAAVTAFSPPALTQWQGRILSAAFGLVGYPYVWGGTSERDQTVFGRRTRGGFDCSGLVWRVYKLQRYDGAPALGETLKGRTTFSMSGEAPASKRIPFAKLQPGDVVFFGARGPQSKPAAVDHSGIYVGGGWFVHASRQGVALARLDGWYRDRFAWARRPLAEAGVE